MRTVGTAGYYNSPRSVSMRHPSDIKEIRISRDEAMKDVRRIFERAENGESFVIEQGGEPVFRVVPMRPRYTIQEYLALLDSLPEPDSQFSDDLAAIANKQPVMVPENPWER
jgi:antitoxin (DNA-binding transcriptional repressor) of toxin-antitoxin stability system